MSPTPEQQARTGIDRLLAAAGWSVQDMAQAKIHAAKIRTTAGQSGVSGGDIIEIPLEIPSIAEQIRIVAEADRRLSLVRRVEAEVDANLKRAEALRQATLSAAFSGRTSVEH